MKRWNQLMSKTLAFWDLKTPSKMTEEARPCKRAIAKDTLVSAILNGHDIVNGHDILEVASQDIKIYKTLEEYCTEVADSLPQRQNFYTMDLADILYKVQQWKMKLPNVEIFYAVKANSDPVLLKLLVLLGLSFDCASEVEIRQVLELGVSPNNIIFAHTIKTTGEMKFAAEVGIDLMTFDNEEELTKIHRIYKQSRLLLRLKPSTVSCKFDLSDKFGCSEEEALQLLRLAKKLGLNVVGVSFHVGALCTDPTSYTSTIRSCRRLFDEAGKMGFDFSVLDIGGGFFGQIGTEDIFNQMAEGIQGALDEYFAGTKTRVIGEPGCYIVASAVRHVCTVIGKKVIKNAGTGQPSRYYYLNDGIYGSFFKDIEQYGLILKPLLPDSDHRFRPVMDSRIFGQTCCSEDVIRPSTPLPDLEVGECVVWENMGAYSRNIYSTFCGMPLPVPKYICMQHNNNSLNLDWIENREEVGHFLKKYAIVIGSKKGEFLT